MKTERQEAVVREVMLIYMWLSRMFCAPSEPSHHTHLQLFINRLPSCFAPAYNKSLSVCRKQKTLLKSMHTEAEEDCIDVHMRGFKWPLHSLFLDTVTS